uniref:DNA2/NAM7 helicase-like C-terminal domain-containing protein n=1 Tax=Globodera rostochiensis TaxID=31243 RepID=A0A914GX66_GLORO
MSNTIPTESPNSTLGLNEKVSTGPEPGPGERVTEMETESSENSALGLNEKEKEIEGQQGMVAPIHRNPRDPLGLAELSATSETSAFGLNENVMEVGGFGDPAEEGGGSFANGGFDNPNPSGSSTGAGQVRGNKKGLSLSSLTAALDAEDEPESGDETADSTSPAWYLIAQVRNDGAVAARIPRNSAWPVLVLIPPGMVETSRPFECGDTVQIEAYERVQTANGWADVNGWQHIPAAKLSHQAVAVKVSDWKQIQFTTALGLVTRVHRDPRTRQLRSADVAALELPCVLKVFRRHLPADLNHTTIRYRGLVRLNLLAINRPQRVLVHNSYVLPGGFPHRTGDELVATNPKVIAGVEGEQVGFEFPFGKELSWEGIQLGEKAMGAAIAAQIADVQAELRKHTLLVEPTIVRIVEDYQIVLSFRRNVQTIEELTQLTETWEEDTAVSCRVDQRDERRPCASGFVTRVEKDVAAPGYVMRAEVILAHQPAKKQSTWEEFQALRDGELQYVELKPMVSTRALQDRAELLAGNNCSNWAKKGDHPNSSLGKMMAILLGRPIAQPQPAITSGIMGFGPLQMLRGGQRDSAELMLDPETRVLFQQAGPGTGKTFTAAAIIAGILQADPQARILAVAPPNVAVVKFVLEMQGVLEVSGQQERMVALFSGAGKQNYAQEVERIAPHLLATAVEPEDFQELLQPAARRSVVRYLRACAQNPRLAQEAAVARLVKEHSERRLCFATLSFAEQVAGLFSETTHLLIDEAGQAPYVQVLSLVGQLPALKKLMITGDRRQLKVHLPSLPVAIREDLGLDTVIQNLDVAEGTDVTTLTVSYRSHPAIVRCVEAGFYRPHNERLTPGRCDAERALLTGQDAFKLPMRGSPLILIHQRDQAERDETSLSSLNQRQSVTAMEVLRVLTEVFSPEVTIRCICLYASQAQDIARRVRETEGLGHVRVTTADATQGHEAMLAVVVTTCSQINPDAEGNPFWASADRVDVALSRASHGLVLIGDLLLLSRTATWQRFLRQATNETVVVGDNYLQAIRDPRSEYAEDGHLMSGERLSVRSEEFYRRFDVREVGQGQNRGGGGMDRYQPYLYQGRRGDQQRQRGGDRGTARGGPMRR